MAENGDVTIEVASAASAIGQEAWNTVANPTCDPTLDFDYNPFQSFAFYDALEGSGSATGRTGWLPQHLVMRDAEKAVLGIVPCYLKNHSQGEYVFDYGWADAFERAGGDYYPKLQASVPFTPATGRRLLVGNGPDADKRRLMLAGGLAEVCSRLDASSAHITFLPENEWNLLGEHGYLRRSHQQFHWLNDGYEGFDHFLEALSSRKRKNIRKERKAALEGNGITIDWLTGDQLTEAIWDRFFQFYVDTGSRKWGQPYLTREFFSLIGETMPNDIVLMMAKREGNYVAGAINFAGSHTLFGRHWGCLEDHPFLHFEVCYYQAIDYAIQHKLARVEAGAQGSHKLARGYMPQTTYSAHYISHPNFRRAVEDYLEVERREVARENEIIARHGPFRQTKDSENG